MPNVSPIKQSRLFCETCPDNGAVDKKRIKTVSRDCSAYTSVITACDQTRGASPKAIPAARPAIQFPAAYIDDAVRITISYTSIAAPTEAMADIRLVRNASELIGR